MAKVRVTDTEIIVRCPAACCGEHRLDRSRWTMTGSVDSPTITPSINSVVNSPKNPDYRPGIPTIVCHSIIRDGHIKFLKDCTHSLRLKTVPLEDVD